MHFTFSLFAIMPKIIKKEQKSRQKVAVIMCDKQM
jgi:hypothetical protein